jgi:hypothetical protein
MAATGGLAFMGVLTSAGAASAAAGNGCPASKVGVPVASNVTASVSTTGKVSTYQFSSLANENPAGGVPGLISYCVYPSATALPTGHGVQAKGGNGAAWVYSAGSNNFAFTRPNGDPTNVPLDGKTTTMGTATWGTVPASQAFVLHINDPAMCAKVYGAGTLTCFVTPAPPPPPGPVCDHGDSNVAYNSMPTDVVNCINPATGFEATSTNEFGDLVNLAPTSGTHVSLQVDFQSFACQSGHWYDATCSSASGATFDWPITANLYDPAGSGGLTTPIATVTTTQTIPYRPSADPSCPAVGSSNVVGAAWQNPQAPGGQCQNSIGKVLTFNFPNVITLPSQVVWTVAFNTSDYGASPQGTQACTGTSGGCPYDSLNVGDKSYPNAPYAGTDPSEDTVYLSQGNPAGSLQAQAGWTGFRPLGEIITTP